MIDVKVNRRWFHLLLLAAAALLLAGFMWTFTASVATAQEVDTATVQNRLNFREGPGTEFDVIQVLDAGTEVEFTGFTDETGNWAEVRLADGTTGWVWTEFLSEAPGDLQVQADQAAEEPAMEEPAEFSPAVVTATTTANLRLREQPGQTFDIIEVLPVGTVVGFTGFTDATGNWVQVDAATGPTGWVWGEFLSNMPTGLEVRPAERVEEEALPEPDFSPAVVTATTTANLRLREGPSLDSNIVDVLPQGTVVGFTGFTDATGNWVQVDSADHPVGWVSAAFLSEVPGDLAVRPADVAEEAAAGAGDEGAAEESPFPSDATTTTTIANLNFREGPSLEFDVIEVLQRGTEVAFTGLMDESGQWVQVQTADGTTGWVTAEFLNEVPNNLEVAS